MGSSKSGEVTEKIESRRICSNGSREGVHLEVIYIEKDGYVEERCRIAKDLLSM